MSSPPPITWVHHPVCLGLVTFCATVARMRIVSPPFRRVIITHRSSFRSQSSARGHQSSCGIASRLGNLAGLYCRGALELGLSLVFVSSRVLVYVATSLRSARWCLGIIFTYHLTGGEAACPFCFGLVRVCQGEADSCPLYSLPVAVLLQRYIDNPEDGTHGFPLCVNGGASIAAFAAVTALLHFLALPGSGKASVFGGSLIDGYIGCLHRSC